MNRSPLPLRPVDIPGWPRAGSNRTHAEDLLSRWLLRHGHPEDLTRWYQAGAGRGGVHAFAAVAADPGLLHRMRPVRASLLARDAAAQADQLLPEGEDDRSSAGPTAAAVAQVRAAIAAWQRTTALRPRTDLPMLLLDPTRSRFALPPAGPELAPSRTVPSSAGEDATLAVTRLGAAGLARLAFREARALTGRVTRYVGQQLRPARSPAADWTVVAPAVLEIQSFAAQAGEELFLTEHYQSAGPSSGHLAASLSADLAVCAAAARIAGSNRSAPGFRAWGIAEEAHAYAAFALDAAAPAALDVPERRRLVRAALRWLAGSGTEPGCWRGAAEALLTSPLEVARRIRTWCEATQPAMAG